MKYSQMFSLMKMIEKKSPNMFLWIINKHLIQTGKQINDNICLNLRNHSQTSMGQQPLKFVNGY